MSDHPPREPGQDDAALPPELARVERLLLAEGRRWRQAEPSTERLERHLRALDAAQARFQTGREERMLTDHETPYQEAPTIRAPKRPPSRWRGPLALVATVLLVAMAASIFALLRMSPGTGANRQNGSATPTPALVRETAKKPSDTHLPLAGNEYLGDVSFSSAEDGWAVGGLRINPGGSTRSAMVHFHDGVWERGADTFPNITLTGVSMVSATDGWAVGARAKYSQSTSGVITNAFGFPVVLRYANGHWREVTVPGLAGAQLRSIHMFSPDSGYITGVLDVTSANGQGVDQVIVVMVYQNGAWTHVGTPFPAYTSQVVMVSASEGWAAQIKDLSPPGGAQNQQTTLYHYLNGAWTAGETFTGAAASLSAQSPQDVWLLATQCYLCTEPSPRIEQYNGSTWARIQAPDESGFPQPAFGATSLTAQSLYDGAASGVWLNYATSDPANQNASYLTSWRFTGTGWALVNASPASGQLVAIIADHSGGMWALTQSDSSVSPLTTTILYSQGDGWTVYGTN